MRAVITPKKLRNRNEASEAILKADLTVGKDVCYRAAANVHDLYIVM